MFRSLAVLLFVPVVLIAQEPRGLIDTIAFKQIAGKAAVQFAWVYKGQVQIPPPVFRTLVYYEDAAGNTAVAAGGAETPEQDSIAAAKGGRKPAKGIERMTVDLPGTVKLHDFRAEMWLNGHLVGFRNSQNFHPEKMSAKGLDSTWWLPKAGTLDEAMLSAINSCIEKGIDWLKEEQKADGHWEGEEDAPTGFTALAALALVKAGVAKDAPEITKALAWLKKTDPRTTYDHGCTMMLLEAVDPVTHKTWIDELAKEVQRVQGNGTWSYEEGNGDLSNSQYGALGLWTAQRAGIEVDVKIWRELGEAVIDFTNPNGSFNYEPKVRRNGASQGSLPMTAAGTGIALICYKMTEGDQQSTNLRPKLVDAANQGYNATARLFDDSATGYSLYGIERAAALINKDLLGRHDWYAEGARLFIKRQEQDGSIDEEIGGKIAGTSFALLFLKRSTRSAMDPEYDPDQHLSDSQSTMVNDAPQADTNSVPEGAMDPLEAEFNQRFPMARIGEQITLRSADGQSLTGKVVEIAPTAVTIEAGGRTAAIPYTRLDKPSRARVDALFRKQSIDARRNR